MIMLLCVYFQFVSSFSMIVVMLKYATHFHFKNALYILIYKSGINKKFPCRCRIKKFNVVYVKNSVS